MKDLIHSIDYTALREQKYALLDLLQQSEPPLEKSSAQALRGLVHLIDNIQDYAVDVAGISKDTVFKIEVKS